MKSGGDAADVVRSVRRLEAETARIVERQQRIDERLTRVEGAVAELHDGEKLDAILEGVNALRERVARLEASVAILKGEHETTTQRLWRMAWKIAPWVGFGGLVLNEVLDK